MTIDTYEDRYAKIEQEAKAREEARLHYERSAGARNAFRAERGIHPSTAAGPLIAYLKEHYREEWERRFRHPVLEPWFLPESWPWYRVDMNRYGTYFDWPAFRLPNPPVQELCFLNDDIGIWAPAYDAVTLTRIGDYGGDGHFTRYFVGLSRDREVWYGVVSYNRRADAIPSPVSTAAPSS